VALYLLDSTVLIDYLRGRPAVERVAALRETGDVPATTAVNMDEIVRGLQAGEEPAARSLFAGLAVLPLGRRVGWQAGEWRRAFAARGITLYQADCLVAGAAWAHKAVLVTGNPKDFPMNDVTVEHWPVGT
jgi:predicted nucleic acid-binding protein